SFERVAELLWTGELPPNEPTWPIPSPEDRTVAVAAGALVGRPGLAALAATATALAEHHPDDTPASAARRLLGVAPDGVTDGDTGDGPLAERLLRGWTGTADPATVVAVRRAL